MPSSGSREVQRRLVSPAGGTMLLPRQPDATPAISPAAAIVTMIGFAPNAPTTNPCTSPIARPSSSASSIARDDPVLQRAQEQHRGHRRRLADREREQVAAEHDHRQTDGDDPDEGRRGEDRLQVADAEEAFRGHCAVHRQHRDDGDPCAERRVREAVRARPVEPAADSAVAGALTAIPPRRL